SRPGCEAGQAALQQLLDGLPDWDSPAAAAHRAVCPACREELSLSRSWSQLTIVPVAVPPDLAPRLLSAAVRDPRRRTLVRTAGLALALAASIVVAVVGFWPTQPPEQGPVVVAPPAPAPAPSPEAPKPISDAVAEARNALVNLTMRTAAETRDGSARLLPSPKMPELPDTADHLEPLADARTGAVRSVEPVTSSARRAFDFILGAAAPPSRPNDQ